MPNIKIEQFGDGWNLRFLATVEGGEIHSLDLPIVKMEVMLYEWPEIRGEGKYLREQFSIAAPQHGSLVYMEWYQQCLQALIDVVKIHQQRYGENYVPITNRP